MYLILHKKAKFNNHFVANFLRCQEQQRKSSWFSLCKGCSIIV